jgi:hypothetical protein
MRKISKESIQKAWDKRHTFDGVVHQRWLGIVGRSRGSKKIHYHTSTGKPHMSKEDFYKLAYNSKAFKELYEAWKESGYLRNLSPSVDRIDVSKGYILGNVQFITMRENNSKKLKDHLKAFGKTFTRKNPVRLWKESGEEMFFESGKEASLFFKKNRLAVTNNIIAGHKLQGWNCEWYKGPAHKQKVE